MGTELMISCVKEEDIDFPPVPPGFEGFSSLKLQEIENNDGAVGYSVPSNTSEEMDLLNSESYPDNVGKISRPLRRRPWINYGQFDYSSEDECDRECSDQPFPSRPCLPKGVIRGCPECPTCQKVTARWCPEAAYRPDLEDVPAFYPTEEEFQDPIKYIAVIRPKAEPYGICRIVPPASWKPPCLLKEKHTWEHSTFATRIQRVDKLQNRGRTRRLSKLHNHMSRKKRRCSRMGEDSGYSSALGPAEAGFGFEPGPEFTLDAFQKYAEDFMVQYFRTEDNQCSGINLTQTPEKWEPSIEALEGEYWRMVEKPTEEIEVLYGADLETGVFGSGFPKISSQGCFSQEYMNSGWNLNNLSRLPGSVLSYENAGISGVQVPWLYIGMCFSSFCWHVEDHHLYSLNYMHFGAAKLWYGVPGKEATNFEQAMRKHLPDLFEDQPDLLHKLVTQLSPAILKSEGVPVYRCVQNPGEFVLTFPRAYHSGFNCGFNCAEAVNVAPIDWFPHGQNAVELYREQRRKTTISHDKLLLGAARESVKAYWELNLLRKHTNDNLRWKDIYGKYGILAKSLRARVQMEYARREFLCNSSKVLKMDLGFDANIERECSICFYDLHLSAAGCSCSPDRFACLNHAEELCPCALSEKFFLVRYDINELYLLVEAVEGKLSAVYRWARLDPGLALSTPISEGNLHENGLLGILSQHPKEVHQGGATSKIEESTRISTNFSSSLTRKGKFATSGAFPQDAKLSVGSQSGDLKPLRNKFLFKRDGNKFSVSSLSAPPHLKSFQKVTLQKNSSIDEKPEVKRSSNGQLDVICLSDDESEQPNEILSDAKKEAAEVVYSNVKTDPPRKVLCTAADGACTGKLDLRGGEHISLSSAGSTKGENDAKCEMNRMADIENVSCQQSLATSTFIRKNEPNAQVSNNSRDEIHKSTSEVKIIEDARTIPGSPSSSQNSLDIYYRQKGPHIAKVVRRINCNVEPLEFGVVMPGKLWSTSQAIFPKGFRSRVSYINLSDPTNMCFYISEIIDGGKKGPLFMVSLEHCPNAVFVHVSPTRCWEMIRERVNQDISKQYKLGKKKLPPLQPPGSLDGLEMFGFTSPPIIQAIESLDKDHISKEYWKSQSSQPKENCQIKGEGNSSQKPPTSGVDAILGGLFKKADPEELHALLKTLGKEMPGTDQNLLTRLLREEIQRRSR